MTYQNAQFKNSGNDEGDILNFFNNHLRTLVQKNGGDNTFSIVEELCHDKDEPIPIGTKTKIRLTHSGHTISQIEKGFIKLDLELKLKLKTPYANDTSLNPCPHLNYIFIGFKNAAEIISELQFWVDGKLISGYHQSEMIKETFAYNSIRPKDSKNNAAHAHSLWESVCCMSPNVAGVYVPLIAFQNNVTVPVHMELNIPFTDLLALQAWRLYPNRILGEVEIEVKFSLDALVWCQLQPKNVGEIKRFWGWVDKGQKEYDAPILPLFNRFSQYQDEIITVKNIEEQTNENSTVVNFGKLPIAYHCLSSLVADKNALTSNWWVVQMNKLEIANDDVRIVKCRSNCSGFGVKPDVIESLMTTLQEPIIIPSQELTKYQFDMRVTGGRIDISKSVPLKNATNITMMFPAKTTHCTVYQNVMLEQCWLSVNKKKYPETYFDNTWDGRFVQYQLMANELDGNIEPTDEFVESISKPINNVYPKHMWISGEPVEKERFLLCPFDNTSFGINFQLERGNSGYVFDGVDSGNQAVSIEFKGNLLNSDTNNAYLYPDVSQTGRLIAVQSDKQEPIPEMWICSDTYWTWSIQDGVQYYPRGRPTGYD